MGLDRLSASGEGSFSLSCSKMESQAWAEIDRQRQLVNSYRASERAVLSGRGIKIAASSAVSLPHRRHIRVIHPMWCETATGAGFD